MKRALRQLWQTHRLLLIAFVVACALTVVFGGRALLQFAWWSDPAHRDQEIAAWMTPGYISHSWKVPPEVVGAAMGFDEKPPGRPPTVGKVAETNGEDPAALAARIEAAIAAYRAENSPVQ